MRIRLPGFAVRFLKRRLENAVKLRRDPDQIVGPDGAPYMLRWILWRRFYLGGIYLHEFHHDDDDRALHDHPWLSVSIMLDGEVREVYAKGDMDSRDPRRHSARLFRAGDVIFRGTGMAHRVELLTTTALTLFFVGPHIKEWGFFCPKGWRHWREYADPADPNKIGRGCD